MAQNTRQHRLDLLSNPVAFVTATEEDNFAKYNRKSTETSSKLTGNEVKKIYEEIIAEGPKNIEISSSSISRLQASKTCRKKSQKNSQVFVENDLFRAAQSGDLETVENCVKRGKLDINSKDGYSWTSLMMAAHEGQDEIVLFLLKEGAEWIDIIDGSGYDARELACLGGHGHIADIFTNSETYVRQLKVQECKKRILKTIKREKLWCDICKCHYYAPPEKQPTDTHRSSTLHLFSDKSSAKPCHSHFYLSGANKGYQLMRGDGWDGESGLGPEKEGPKYPVKTVLKRDRLGFGANTSKIKPRVTHFGAHDKNAIIRCHIPRKNGGNNNSTETKDFNSKSKRKKYIFEEEANVKEREMNFRRLFY